MMPAMAELGSQPGRVVEGDVGNTIVEVPWIVEVKVINKI